MTQRIQVLALLAPFRASSDVLERLIELQYHGRHDPHWPDGKFPNIDADGSLDAEAFAIIDDAIRNLCELSVAIRALMPDAVRDNLQVPLRDRTQ